MYFIFLRCLFAFYKQKPKCFESIFNFITEARQKKQFWYPVAQWVSIFAPNKILHVPTSSTDKTMGAYFTCPPDHQLSIFICPRAKFTCLGNQSWVFPTLQKYPLKGDLKLKVNVSNYMYNDFMTFKRQASEMYLVFPGRANLVIWKHSDYHSS